MLTQTILGLENKNKQLEINSKFNKGQTKMADLSYEANLLRKLNDQLKTENQDLKDKVSNLEFKIQTKQLVQTTFGRMKLNREAKTGLQSKDPTDEQRFAKLNKKIIDLQAKLEHKQNEINSHVNENQMVVHKLYKIEKTNEDLKTKFKRLKYYEDENNKLRFENHELHHEIIDILKENSEIWGKLNKLDRPIHEKLIQAKSLVKSDGEHVKPTYIEKLIKQNSKLKLESMKAKPLRQTDRDQKSTDPDASRFEKKRERKRKQKELDLDPPNITRNSIQNSVDQAMMQRLERSKTSLENELKRVKTEWELEKSRLETQITALKDRLDSTARNYKILQEEMQKNVKEIDNTVELKAIELRRDYDLLKAKYSDLEYTSVDLQKDLQMHEKTVEFYKNTLKKSRDDYKTLLDLQMRTQAKLKEAENPSLENDHPHAVEVRRLNLKIESLNLVNDQLNRLVIDSKKVSEVIKITWTKEIDKFTENIKLFIEANKLMTNEKSKEGAILNKTYDEMLVENSQLRSLVDGYHGKMEDMKSQIKELTTDLDESR